MARVPDEIAASFGLERLTDTEFERMFPARDDDDVA